MTYRLVKLTMALAVLCLSGCALFGDNSDPLDNLREQLRATVHDQQRADAMLASVDELDQLLIESAELPAEAVRQERLLFADYESTPQDFELLYAERARKREKLRDEMLDVHLEFKARATAAEWEVILPVHVKAVSSRIESLIVDARRRR